MRRYPEDLDQERTQMQAFIHPQAIVETNAIGRGTRVWAFAHVLAGASIGEDCNICDHTFIEGGVRLGDRVTVKCGVYLWSGVTLEDDVFVGPSVIFTNDLRPRSRQYKTPTATLVSKGASLGAGSIALAGITVGAFAMTGIGSVLTRDVPSHALVYGNPARFRGWVDEEGGRLVEQGAGLWRSEAGVMYQEGPSGLRRAG